MAGEIFVNMELIVDGKSRGVQAFIVGDKPGVVLVAEVNGSKVEIVADASVYGK